MIVINKKLIILKSMSNLESPLEDVENKNVLVAFGARWCSPYGLLQSTLKEIEDKGIEVIRIDVDEHPKLSDQYAVVSLPTFIVLRKGKEARRKLGAISRKELSNLGEDVK